MPAVEERSSYSPTEGEIKKATDAFIGARRQVVPGTRTGLNYLANAVFGKNTDENREKVVGIIQSMIRTGSLDRFDIGGQDHFKLMP